MVRLLVALTLVVLAGCKSASQREKSPPPDWESSPPETIATPAAPTPPPAVELLPEPTETWQVLHRWAARRGLGAPLLLGQSPSPIYSLSTTNGIFTFQSGVRPARFDGVEFWLGFAPQVIDGELYLHSVDLKKNIEPLLSPFKPGSNPYRVVVIDPGHGGGNTGTQSVVDKRYEKEFTLDWAMRLAPLLRQNGWIVYLTRTNDVEVPLGDRVTFAESVKADLFLSLHFNAAGNSSGASQSGVETYCLTPAGLASSLTREFEDDLSAVYPNNAFDVLNFQYAVRLHRSLLALGGSNDRGVRRARFMGVLRGQNRPAVLLEAAYLSNPTEARRVADPAYRQQLAEAVARALSP
ncbi:MAG TPA: N-acetylmuramoyl-L-alanine amidase [Verrucomicrobiota bacterium]|nr:N-acetylmuramoyl-L-alanine amidase [Verrucomicrobiota bacterium]